MPRLLTPAATRLLLITAASLLFTAACGKTEDRAAETATAAAIEAATGARDVEVDEGGAGIRGVGEDGRAFSLQQGGQARLPADFPADVALPEGLALDMVLTVEGSTSIAGRVPARRAAELVAAIERRMGAEGWSRELDTRQDGSTMLVWKKDGRHANYLFEDHADGHVLVNLGHFVQAKDR
ncbi:hypothetical protein [Silanimonas lenta]|jgi:hypothetical protein|uniref:hypothetical protein n=1 Tax=Silanimonas lenta TaxID=265429 RepID=UPI0004138EDC|nr:hypothetical protein [Silanimonas lenta]